jgi:hypothetical protein
LGLYPATALSLGTSTNTWGTSYLSRVRSGGGTTALPAYSSTIDSSSGLYSPLAADVRIAISGADAALFSASALTIPTASHYEVGADNNVYLGRGNDGLGNNQLILSADTNTIVWAAAGFYPLTARGLGTSINSWGTSYIARVRSSGGTVALPAFSSTVDATTGTYTPSAGDWRVSISGTDALRVTSSLLTYNGNNVAIGSGSTSQYLRGNGSLSTFATDVEAIALNLMTAPAGAVDWNTQDLTSVKRLGIATNSFSTVTNLAVGAAVTADTTANAMITATATGAKALVVQAQATPSVNPFEVQDSTGAAPYFTVGSAAVTIPVAGKYRLGSDGNVFVSRGNDGFGNNQILLSADGKNFKLYSGGMLPNSALAFGSATNPWGSITINDGASIVTSANTTGLKIGAAAGKIGFYATAPVAQASRAGQLTDNSTGVSGGNTIAAVTTVGTAANAIATLAAKVNALETIIHNLGLSA